MTEESQVNPAAVDGSPIKEEKQQGSFWRAQFEDTGLTVLRIVFLIITGGISVFVIYSVSSGENPPIPLDKFGWAPYAIFFGMLLLAAGVIAFDMIIREKRLETISAVYFGLLVGLFLAYITRLALTPIFPSSIAAGAAGEKILAAVQLVLTIMLCYLCISFLLQTRHDFRFIIPYVEFARELRGRRPYVVDTSVIIDGRIADILERTRLFDSTLVIPRFVIEELQMIADGVDRAKRSRGRRGAGYPSTSASQSGCGYSDFRPGTSGISGPRCGRQARGACQAPGGPFAHERLQSQQSSSCSKGSR